MDHIACVICVPMDGDMTCVCLSGEGLTLILAHSEASYVTLLEELHGWIYMAFNVDGHNAAVSRDGWEIGGYSSMEDTETLIQVPNEPRLGSTDGFSNIFIGMIRKIRFSSQNEHPETNML